MSVCMFFCRLYPKNMKTAELISLAQIMCGTSHNPMESLWMLGITKNFDYRKIYKQT